MTTVVMAGGGLTCWYVAGRLAASGEPIEVWYADADQIDEALTGAFLEHMSRLGVPVRRHDLRGELAMLGLELARAQARHRNGYWNTTGLLRVGLVTACARWMSETRPNARAVAHGCVGLGNDQRRFHNLFGTLRPDVAVETRMVDWAAAGETPSRAGMVEAIGAWSGVRDEALARKALWSSDGSVLGVSHEGTQIEDHDSDWTQAPFVMTADPLSDTLCEDVVIEFANGELTSVGDVRGSPHALLAEANRRAGARGIGRLGVMEDRLKGTKCRGVYEAPGLALIGTAFAVMQELCLSAGELQRFDALSRAIAADTYAGHWHEPQAQTRRTEIAALCAGITGSVTLALRGGHVLPRRTQAASLAAEVEQRFARGGVMWSAA